MNELSNLPRWLWIVLVALLLSQGGLLFRDARIRGKWPWFWGLWGMTTIPLPTILYLLFVVYPEARRQEKLKTEEEDRLG